MRNTKGWLKFHQEANGSKLSKRRLDQLSENPRIWSCLWAEFVCEAGKFFQRCLLETFCSPEGDTIKSYNSKGICSIALKYWQWLVLHIKNKTLSLNFLFQNTFCFKSDFCMINAHFLNPISKMFCNFSLKLNMANLRQAFLVLWPRNRRNTLNKRKTKFASIFRLTKKTPGPFWSCWDCKTHWPTVNSWWWKSSPAISRVIFSLQAHRGPTTFSF